MSFTPQVLSIAKGGNGASTMPGFLAYQAANVNNVTGNGTVYTIGSTALTELYDFHSNFNTNGVFTAPIDGFYLFCAGVEFRTITTATDFRITLLTSNRSYVNEGALGLSGGYVSLSINTFVDMETNDTARVQIFATGQGADTVGIAGASLLTTFFGGIFIRPLT